MRATKTELGRLPSRELIMRLLTSDSDDRFTKDVILERLQHDEEIVFVKKTASSPSAKVETSTTPPLSPNGLNDVAAKYTEMLESGWRGEGMNDPADAVKQMRVSIAINESLASIADFEPAVR